MTPSEENRLVIEISAMRQSVESLKTGLRPIERAMRSMTLVPLALVFCGVSTWLFNNGKISEDTWFWINVILMSPFFGEGIRAVLDKVTGIARAEKIEKLAQLVVFGIGVIGALSGCQQYTAWDKSHERTYAVTYDADSKSGAVSMTIRPAASASVAPAPAAGMTDETIAKIVKIISDQAVKQQAAAILETPALK